MQISRKQKLKCGLRVSVWSCCVDDAVFRGFQSKRMDEHPLLDITLLHIWIYTYEHIYLSIYLADVYWVYIRIQFMNHCCIEIFTQRPKRKGWMNGWLVFRYDKVDDFNRLNEIVLNADVLFHPTITITINLCLHHYSSPLPYLCTYSLTLIRSQSLSLSFHLYINLWWRILWGHYLVTFTILRRCRLAWNVCLENLHKLWNVSCPLCISLFA